MGPCTSSPRSPRWSSPSPSRAGAAGSADPHRCPWWSRACCSACSPASDGFGADPELILSLALPPLLFAAALNSSFIGIRANRRPILLLSVGLVVFTALVVALALRLAVPGVPWSVALTLGAVLGPTDAVAASAIGGRLGLPPRILTILEGESLVNDGTGLTLFRVAVAAVVAGSMTAARATAILLLAVVGGVALGPGALGSCCVGSSGTCVTRCSRRRRSC